MKITIKEIAKITGVSVATVSRALNGKEDVGEDTRKRILSVAKDLNYEPNAIARGLLKNRGFAIGIVVSDITNAYFAEVFRGVEEIASQEDYVTVFYNTDYKAENERMALRLLSTNRVDGLIMQVSNRVVDECRSMVAMGYPIVLFGQILEGVECPMVGCNNQASAYTITEHLIQAGHRDIAHVGGHKETRTGIQRKQGFREAMENYGLDLKNDWIVSTDYRLAGAYESVRGMLERKEKPSAIFAANDDIAAGCYRAIYERGMRIPEDISLVGHDDTVIATLLRPNLTTMEQKKREIGRIAARKLIASIKLNQKPASDITIVPTELVERDSVLRLN